MLFTSYYVIHKNGGGKNKQRWSPPSIIKIMILLLVENGVNYFENGVRNGAGHWSLVIGFWSVILESKAGSCAYYGQHI